MMISHHIEEIETKMTTLEKARRSLGLSQKALAVASGVQQATISKAEQGMPMTRDKAEKIAKFFGHPYEEKYFIYPERYLIPEELPVQQAS